MSSQPKFKKITDIPPKCTPPRPIGPDGKEIPWAETPQTFAYIVGYAENARQREKEAKLEAKRREEELRMMEEYQNKQRERRKREQEVYKKLPEQQLEMFLSGKRYICSGCHLPQYYQADCRNRNGPAS